MDDKPDTETETETQGQRVTVKFNGRDMSRIEAEVQRQEAESGYKVYVSDVLRDLVRLHFPVPE